MPHPRTLYLTAAIVALAGNLLPACGKSAPKRQPSADPPTAAAPTTTGPAAAPPAAPPVAPPAATPPTGPVLGDTGLVGLTPAQMTSAPALQTAFPTAKVATSTRRYCPRGTVQSSATECKPEDGAAVPVRTYQVITVTGRVARPAAQPGKTDGSYLLQVIADGDHPQQVSIDVGRLDPADLGPMPATLAAARRWRPGATCAWEGYPEASAHLLCTYGDGPLQVITQGPAPKIDGDSPAADAEWDVDPAGLPAWIDQHGDDPVTTVAWGDEPGTQAW